MVDRVTIDPAYDGKVFNIALADVPERKTDYVQGCYELPAPKGKTTVAVKVTDMLGGGGCLHPNLVAADVRRLCTNALA